MALPRPAPVTRFDTRRRCIEPQTMRILMASLALFLFSCADEALLDPPPPCLCAEEGACSEDFCSYSFSLDASCEGKVAVAELLIDGHLEETPLRYPADAPVVPCMRTAPGETSEIFLRGGSWLWGSEAPGAGQADPMLLKCEEPATVHQRTFECRDKTTGDLAPLQPPPQ